MREKTFNVRKKVRRIPVRVFVNALPIKIEVLQNIVKQSKREREREREGERGSEREGKGEGEGEGEGEREREREKEREREREKENKTCVMTRHSWLPLSRKTFCGYMIFKQYKYSTHS